MPRKQTILIYQFDELSKKAKEKARDWFRKGALDYEWWDSIYEDAANIGLKITGFDLGRGQDIEGKFTKPCEEVAKLIVKDHGDKTETYKLAEEFLDKGLSEDDDYEKYEAACEEFLRDLLQEYWSILEKESEYLTSDEAIDENIEANEYEFNEDGSRTRV